MHVAVPHVLSYECRFSLYPVKRNQLVPITNCYLPSTVVLGYKVTN